jgi:hypothetical protein
MEVNDRQEDPSFGHWNRGGRWEVEGGSRNRCGGRVMSHVAMDFVNGFKTNVRAANNSSTGNRTP